MAIKRQPYWKQKSPRDQMVALASAASGHLLNIRDGDTASPSVTAEKALDLLEQAQEILEQIDPGHLQWHDAKPPGYQPSERVTEVLTKTVELLSEKPMLLTQALFEAAGSKPYPRTARFLVELIPDNELPYPDNKGINDFNRLLQWEVAAKAERISEFVTDAVDQSKDVHTEHCCATCGCKYGNEECTVATGLLDQSYECEEGHQP